MNEAASFDAILQCNLLEVFCEALGAAIFVTDKLDEVSFASIRLLHLFPIRESAIAPGVRARDLYGALYDAGCRFSNIAQPTQIGREDWIGERIASAWKERVDTVEQAGPDRWIRIVSRRFSSGLGFVVLQDVTEQKKKENLLRSEQERVKLTEDILDTLPVAVAVKDRHLDYVAVNQEFCQLIGVSREALLGHGSWDAVSPELAGRIEQMDWHLLSSGEPGLSQIVHERPDGETVTVERRTRRLGRPGAHFIAISLMPVSGQDAFKGERIICDDMPAPAHRPVPAPASKRAAPLRRVVHLSQTAEPSQALTLALRAHGTELCNLRDARELSAFLPACRSAGLAIDLVVIDFGFDPAAFDLVARAGLDFRMLPFAAEQSTALAIILNALRESRARPSQETENAAPDTVPTTGASTASLLDILAVEDNLINRLALEQMLSGLPWTFRIVATGAEGLRECSQMRPRLVLCDSTLPDMTLVEFAANYRHGAETGRLVALVSSDSEESHRPARAAGIDQSLAKPISADALAGLAGRLLDIESTGLQPENGCPTPSLRPRSGISHAATAEC
jgi:PAS domain S-box-containing protein